MEDIGKNAMMLTCGIECAPKKLGSAKWEDCENGLSPKTRSFFSSFKFQSVFCP